MSWQIPALRMMNGDVICYIASVTAGDVWLMAEATPETRTQDMVVMSVKDDGAEWNGLDVKNPIWGDLTDETLANLSQTLGILTLNKTGVAEFALLAVPPKFYTTDIESGRELIVMFLPAGVVVENV